MIFIPHQHGGGGCGGLIQSFPDPHTKNLLEHEFGINPPPPPPHHHHTTTSHYNIQYLFTTTKTKNKYIENVNTYY